jgi:beta-galactosidase GanA
LPKIVTNAIGYVERWSMFNKDELDEIEFAINQQIVASKTMYKPHKAVEKYYEKRIAVLETILEKVRNREHG